MDERRPAPYRCPTLPQLPHRMIQRVRDGVCGNRLALEQLLVERLRDDGTIFVAHGPVQTVSI
jgi:hypothetical protein